MKVRKRCVLEFEVPEDEIEQVAADLCYLLGMTDDLAGRVAPGSVAAVSDTRDRLGGFLRTLQTALGPKELRK